MHTCSQKERTWIGRGRDLFTSLNMGNLRVKSRDIFEHYLNLCELMSFFIFSQHSDEFISRRLEKLLNLMIEVLPYCHFSAKRHRLDCLYFLIVHISKVISMIFDIISICEKFCYWII